MREEWGDREAAALTPQQIDQWLSKRCKVAATANRYRALLSLGYRLGIANGVVAINPARLVRQRKEDGARLPYLIRDEYDRLCTVIQKRFSQHLAEFVTSVHTGMRLSEQYTCTWGQVDLERRAIRLTKTKNGSARTVHLNADAVAAIKSLRISGQKPADKVFPREGDADRFDTRSWFAPCLEEAGITGYVWHCDRHTFCSWLAMAGATIKEIQELARHKTISISARYAHLSPDHKLSVIERISGATQQPTNQRDRTSRRQTATKTATSSEGRAPDAST